MQLRPFLSHTSHGMNSCIPLTKWQQRWCTVSEPIVLFGICPVVYDECIVSKPLTSWDTSKYYGLHTRIAALNAKLQTFWSQRDQLIAMMIVSPWMIKTKQMCILHVLPDFVQSQEQTNKSNPKKMMKQEELVEGKCCRVYSIISPVKLWFPSQLSLGFSTPRSPELWMQQLMAWAPIYGTCRACWERFPKTGLPRVIIFWDPWNK